MSESTKRCKCGCGTPVPRRKTFVDKFHQLEWMKAGGASEMNALQPIEAKMLGGAVAGTQAAENGRLQQAAIKGAERSKEIAAAFREQNGPFANRGGGSGK